MRPVARSRAAQLGWDRRRSAPARTPEERALAQRKVAYECMRCGVKVWGKPGLNVACLEHPEPWQMIQAPPRQIPADVKA